MPEGSVGAGGQNDWKKLGKIVIDETSYENGNFKKFSTVIEYKKGNITENSRRTDNEFWSAGTPVMWNDDPSKAKPVTIELAGIPDMLVTKVNGKITEYHPVITFFNEVMFRIMKDGLRNVISNLEKEENAVKMWKYLEEKYLKDPQKINGSSVKKIVASKKKKPVKKSKVTKLTKRSSL
jgi:hypothetical protein